MLTLPESRDGRLVLLGVVFGLLLAGAGLELKNRFTDKPAAPEVVDFSSDNRTEDVRRGPVKITRRTETRPDGSKVVEQTREIASEERHSTVAAETRHQEIPAPPRPSRTRYVGVGVDPLDYARLPRLRAGLTLWERLDAGVAYDARRPVLGGALTLEAAYRF